MHFSQAFSVLRYIPHCFVIEDFRRQDNFPAGRVTRTRKLCRTWLGQNLAQWRHGCVTTPCKKNQPPDHLRSKVSSLENCPMVLPRTNSMGQRQLQRDYRGGEHVPTYGSMGWSSSTVLKCTCVSSRERCAAALGSERAPKCFTTEGSVPLRVACIFPRERMEKTCLMRTSHGASCRLSLCISLRKAKIKLGFLPVLRGKDIHCGREE